MLNHDTHYEIARPTNAHTAHRTRVAQQGHTGRERLLIHSTPVSASLIDLLDGGPYEAKQEARIAVSACTDIRKDPPSTADNGSSEWAMRDLNPRHPRCKRENTPAETPEQQDLTARLAAACTAACTRLSETGHGEALTTLAEELRCLLSEDEIRRLGVVMSEGSRR